MLQNCLRDIHATTFRSNKFNQALLHKGFRDGTFLKQYAAREARVVHRLGQMMSRRNDNRAKLLHIDAEKHYQLSRKHGHWQRRDQMDWYKHVLNLRDIAFALGRRWRRQLDYESHCVAQATTAARSTDPDGDNSVKRLQKRSVNYGYDKEATNDPRNHLPPHNTNTAEHCNYCHEKPQQMTMLHATRRDDHIEENNEEG